MSKVDLQIRSTWLHEVVKNKRLWSRLQNLKLKNGEFQLLYSMLTSRTKIKSKVRAFWAEGPNGGVHGVLLARKRSKRGPVHIGVYVDRKKRRQRIATRLVSAASSHYPRSRLRGHSWNEASSQFLEQVHCWNLIGEPS